MLAFGFCSDDCTAGSDLSIQGLVGVNAGVYLRWLLDLFSLEMIGEQPF